MGENADDNGDEEDHKDKEEDEKPGNEDDNKEKEGDEGNDKNCYEQRKGDDGDNNKNMDSITLVYPKLQNTPVAPSHTTPNLVPSHEQ